MFVALQNNFIQTSKYTFLSFVTLNLLDQFQRPTIFLSLCVLILQFVLQFFPVWSSLTPVITAVPLSIVLLLTAIKDAIEDYVSIFVSISFFRFVTSSKN
jgi:hypothetical protein